MLKFIIRKSAAGAALAMALAGAGPVHALTGSMSWDPEYGAPFLDGADTTTNMFWSGDANYFVPVACEASLIAGATVTCTGMEVRNMTVKLSDGDLLDGGSLVNTLTFTDALSISTMQLDDQGNVAWVKTDLYDDLIAGAGTKYNLASYGFTISFDSSGSRLYHASTAVVDAHKNGAGHVFNGVGNGHFREACGTDDPFKINFKLGDKECGLSATSARIDFSPIAVPEPQTYALMLAGLAAIGFVARRRRVA